MFTYLMTHLHEQISHKQFFLRETKNGPPNILHVKISRIFSFTRANKISSKIKHNKKTRIGILAYSKQTNL